MSGQTSRSGFLFSDIYLLDLALRDSLDVDLSILSGQADGKPKYGIEASIKDGDDKDWDVLVIETDKCRVQEVKSGAISAQDRRVFWLRIRSLVSDNGHEKVVPQLVVNSENRPAAFPAWQGLRAHAISVSALQLPKDSPKDHVTNVEKLMEEALWWMCCATHIKSSDKKERKIASRVVEPATALRLLRSFDLILVEKSKLDEALSIKLSRLFSGLDHRIARNQLQGWLTNKAVSEQNDLKLFSAIDLITEVEVLRKFVERPKDGIRLLKFLADECRTAILQYWASKTATENIPELTIDRTQPEAASWLASQKRENLVLLGEAGQGKSVCMRQIYSHLQRCPDVSAFLPFRASDMQRWDERSFGGDFAVAIELFIDISYLGGKRPTILVDELDQVNHAKRKQILHALDMVSSKQEVSIVVSCRSVDWQRDGAQLPRSKTVELAKWESALVEQTITGDQIARSLSPALKELVRVPFYLDLLVRTFDGEDSDPKGIETRHALLSAFWNAKVIAGHDASFRAGIIERAIDHECIGRALRIADVSEAERTSLDSLVSCGVLTKPSAHQVVYFRHPLFLAFAGSQRIIEKIAPEQIHSEIARIKVSVVRWGLHRAVVEAMCEGKKSEFYPLISIDQYMQKSDANVSHDVADILGEFECLDSIFIEQWKELDPDFGARLLRAATRTRNGAWLKKIAAWPQTKGWAASVNWINVDFFRACFEYVGEMSKQTEIAAATLSVCRGLREWSESNKLPKDNRYANWVRARIVEIVATTDPTKVTIRWISELSVISDYRLISACLGVLPVLAFAHSGDLNALAEIDESFRNLVSLRKSEGVWDVSEEFWSAPVFDHDALDWCLLGTRKGEYAGLLATNPPHFLKTAVDLFEGCWLREQRRKSARNKKLRESSVGDLGEIYEALYKDDLKVPTGDDWFERDYPEYTYWGAGDTSGDCFKLARAIAHAVHEMSARGTSELSKVIEVVRTSRSPTTHAILVNVLFDLPSCALRHETLMRYLMDRRFYDVPGTAFWIEKAIAAVWSEISSVDKNKVISVALEAFDDDEFHKNHLLAQLPESDVPEGWRLTVQAFKQSDKFFQLSDPTQRERISARFESDHSADGDFAAWGAVSIQEAMKALHKATKQLPQQPRLSIDQTSALCAEVDRAVAELNGDVGSFRTETWIFVSIGKVFDACTGLNGKKDTTGIWPSIKTARLIATTCMDILESTATVFENDEFDDSALLQLDYMRVLDCIDSVLIHPELRISDILNRFGIYVVQALSRQSENMRWAFGMEIRPFNWFATPTIDTKSLFVEVAKGAKSYKTLSLYINLFRYLDDNTVGQCFSLLLNRDEFVDAKEYLSSLGRTFGAYGVSQGPNATIVNELFDKAIRGEHEAKVLANEQARLEFLWDYLFGLKEAASQNWEECVPGTYCYRIQHLWELIYDSERKRATKPENFWLYATSWISDLATPESTRILKPWFVPLTSVIREAVQSGSKYDIYMIFDQILERKNNSFRGTFFLVGLDWYTELAQLVVKRADGSDGDPRAGDITNAKWQSWVDVLDKYGEAAALICENLTPTTFQLNSCVQVMEIVSKAPFESRKCEGYLRRMRDVGEGLVKD